jgi:hypothetical protein
VLSDNLIFYFLFLFTGAVLAILIAAVRAVSKQTQLAYQLLAYVK